ncbi:MAG: hypothetical protein CVU51_00200 [Deltaproteobacteria bacterium HGW-Deltaproteobacteria-1]|jgi:two-component system sensor histidine kinase HydH|nr:MAG: hypothetical protein CVU51_00200 [Deltaproteobacteria bacterium HGW-Deltaproteobacteria-1]
MKFNKYKIPTTRSKKLFIPIFSILAVVITLFILLGISTYRHLHQYQFRMEQSLSREGKIILKSLEASFHTGMMGMMGRSDNLQEIMVSIANLSDIHFIALLDQRGIILAHSNEHLIGTAFPQKEKITGIVKQDEPKSWFGDKGVFFVAKKMDVFPAMGQGDDMADRMRYRRHAATSPSGTLLDQVFSGQVYAVVGLDTKSFEEARDSDLRHAVMMGLILLIMGTAGLYFIFLVQNYYITQRALNAVTLYANHVVENMPDGLLSIDSNGDIVTMNYRAKEILSLTGKWPEKEASKEQLRSIIGPILNSLKEKTPVMEYEVEFPGQQGKFIPLALSAARLVAETGEDLGAVIILRDLREIKELQEKIKRSERLASLGTLAAGMAHEIRNPLSSIKGFAQYFLKKNPPGSEGQKYSQVIIQEVERLNRLISNLLDFARPKEPVKMMVPLEAVIQHTIELIKDDARTKGIQVKTETAEHLPLLLMDSDQITQALLNIMLNGLDVLKAGGTISIRALLNLEKKIIVIEIEDDGPGLPGEDMSKIFDPFYTTKRTGTGLGLAIAYRIIEKHQGTLTVNSKPGVGSIFQIALPLITEETNE